MNKMIKLPLFLGIVGAICGGVLALTNFLTADKIAEDEAARANAAYLIHFSDLKTTQQEEVTSALSAAGVTEKLYVYSAMDISNASYLGSIYTCSVTGYAGKSSPVKFQVSFRNGTYNHYVTISSSESSVGAQFISWLEGDNNGDRLSNMANSGTGSSVTYGAVSSAVTVCYNDYLVDYASMK